jgi:hypothetical protein
VSLVEEQTLALNLRAAQDSKNAAIEHMAVLNRERLVSEACCDPRVIAFKLRRVAIAMQTRYWKPSIDQVLPKKRHK